MIPYRWIEQARERIAAHIRRTPLTYDPELRLFGGKPPGHRVV
jgi:hypothetical protein